MQIINGAFSFDADKFHHQTLKVIAALKLPFRSLNNIELQRWIKMAMYAKRPISLLTPFVARNRLVEQVNLERQALLQRISPHQRLALALDCWTSPNGLPFLAITGYATTAIPP